MKNTLIYISHFIILLNMQIIRYLIKLKLMIWQKAAYTKMSSGITGSVKAFVDFALYALLFTKDLLSRI